MALFAVASASAAPRQLQEGRDVFVGPTGCKSSSCHGGAGPLRSQFITWSRQDFHTRAYAVLVNARSARIAETLGLPQAQTSARCTVCHSPFQAVPPSQLAIGVRPDEGVSCESCHGAAGGWLRGHTRRDWTYATRVGAGMHDLRNLYVRANACVACHQNVEPELLHAGHPELLFELDRQSVAEPKHWVDPPSASGPRQWLTGQAVALREMSSWLARGEGAERERERWNGLVWVLAKTIGVETIAAPTSAPSAQEFTDIQHAADDLARQAAGWKFDDAGLLATLRRFAAADGEFTVTRETSAEALGLRAARLVPAIQRLAAGLPPGVVTRLNLEPAIALLAGDLRPSEPFEAAAFAAHLQSFGAALAQPTR